MSQVQLIFNQGEHDAALGIFLVDLCRRIRGISLVPVGDLGDLKEIIFLNPGLRSLALLSLMNEEDLAVLQEIAWHFSQTDLILLLPSEKHALIDEVLKLFPRYIVLLPEEIPSIPALLEGFLEKLKRLSEAERAPTAIAWRKDKP